MARERASNGSTKPAQRRPLLQRWFYRFSRFWCWLGLRVFFAYRCAGHEHVPAAGGALVCANHQSYFDPVIVGVAFRRRLNYLARASLFRNLAFRWLIRYLDAFPIEREGLGLAGLKETMRRLRRGEMVLIFPEGTRTRDGNLHQLKPGFLVVARRCGVPLIPVGVDGAFQAWPRSKKLPRLSRVAAVIGEPVSSEDLAELDDSQAIALLSERMRVAFERAQAMRAKGKPA